MITLRNVHKAFGHQVLFDGASLQINDRDRFVLVGPNGAGKSTLFKMLLGQSQPDSGELTVRRGVVAGYLPQETAPVGAGTIIHETLSEIHDPDGRVTAQAKAILMGLGFTVADFDRPLKTLSGGWAMRVAIARLLILEPDLLLLDEPTNHLDIDSLFWFQAYLQAYPGAVFLISHDRAFINAVGRAIVSVQDRQLKTYHGDYDYFLRERGAERERLVSAWTRQQEEIAQMQDFISRNRARASTANRAQSMIKRLEKLEKVVLPPEAKTIRIRFPQPRRTGVRVLSLKHVRKSYGEVKVYDGLDFELERGWKCAFLGHNGAGKSTLLKVLGGVIPFDSGERVMAQGVTVGYFSQHREGQFDPDKTVLEEAMANDRMNPDLMVRSVLGSFLFSGDAVHKKTAVLSGGEKSRLALVKLLLDPPNVLLLDEPTTHLDMASVDALIEALKEYEGTVCCISHEVYFLNALVDHVVHIDRGKITWYPGNYDYFTRRRADWLAENPHRVAVPVVKKKAKLVRGRGGTHSPARAERHTARQSEKLEARLVGLATRLEGLAHQLSDPAIYADYKQVRDIGEEMEQVQAEMQRVEADMLRGMTPGGITTAAH